MTRYEAWPCTFSTLLHVQLAAAEAQLAAEAGKRRNAEEAAIAAVHRAKEAAQQWELAVKQAAAADGVFMHVLTVLQARSGPAKEG